MLNLDKRRKTAIKNYPIRVVGKESISFPTLDRSANYHFSISPNAAKESIKKALFVKKGKKICVNYSILPIDSFVAKYGKPSIETQKDDDLSKYINGGIAEKEHVNGIAKTNIVFYRKKILGYFTLRLTTIHTTIQINNKSNAYEGCEILRAGTPIVELLMYARDDNNNKLPMKIVFKKEVLPRVKKLIKLVGTKDLYLECDEKIANVYEKLGFRAYADFFVDGTRMLAMLRPIEL